MIKILQDNLEEFMEVGKKIMLHQVQAKLTRIQTTVLAKTQEFLLNQLLIRREVT